MNQEQNPYRGAKPFLVKGIQPVDAEEVVYICYALNHARSEHVIPAWADEKAGDVVSNRLGYHATLDGWACKNIEGFEKHHEYRQNYPGEYKQKMQAFRHRWLDELADEWDRTDGRMDDPKEFSQ